LALLCLLLLNQGLFFLLFGYLVDLKDNPASVKRWRVPALLRGGLTDLRQPHLRTASRRLLHRVNLHFFGRAELGLDRFDIKVEVFDYFRVQIQQPSDASGLRCIDKHLAQAGLDVRHFLEFLEKQEKHLLSVGDRLWCLLRFLGRWAQ
jgi:hypothetical protein